MQKDSPKLRISARISSKDDIAYLTESSINTSARNTNRSTDGGASSALTDRMDTIHYLSPASTIDAARTEHEGDLDYQQFYISPLYHQAGGHLDHVDDDGLQSPISGTTTSSISCDENTLQRTVAIIKPEAMYYKDVTLRAIRAAGLKIVHTRHVHLTPEQVSEIYEKYYGTPQFPNLVLTGSVGPMLVLALQSVNAIEKWKSLIGPMGTLREEWFFPYSVKTRFGLLSDMPNSLHASETTHDAKKENRFFYPRDIQEPLPADPEKVRDYIKTYVHSTLLCGLADVVKKKPVDPIIHLAEWLLLNNPYQPNYPGRIAALPT
ncbi:nucleoside diphosphate kinase homolog 5-like [Anthonomus grandis grandis]|uniref:nucleoside diphosphate kinase homolog 5-like n=1 Tax=Anthonomus grandis grandis TaxID=2921223 RepID=UPI002165A274|nr:nucleoside diphosphate kinase homolog 5-like [Anthonomus grandis grandis]